MKEVEKVTLSETERLILSEIKLATEIRNLKRELFKLKEEIKRNSQHISLNIKLGENKLWLTLYDMREEILKELIK